MKKKIITALSVALLTMMTGISAFAGTYSHIDNCNEWVSLRSYPSTSAPRITKVYKGESVNSIGWSNGFNQVVYNGQTGWILSQYVVADSNYSYNTYSGYRIVNCNEWVSLRTSPSTSAKRIACVPLGARVTVYSWGHNGFAYVSYDGLYGYILSQYIG